MRLKLLATAFVVLALAATGCRSHIHAGGGQGFDAGASVGPRPTYYAAPVVVTQPPPATIDLPQPMPPR